MKNQTLKFIVFLFIIIFCWSAGRFLNFDIEQFKAFFNRFPVILSGLIFVPLYIALTFFIWMGPKDVFRVMGAVLFGPYISTLFVWLAELGNAYVLFHFSRKLGRDFIEQKFGLKSTQLDHVKEGSGYFGVFTLRINPLIPFRFMDLGAGLTAIPFRTYFNGIFLSSLLRIFWLQAILAGVGTAMFQDIDALHQFMLDNPSILLYSTVYFLVVIILSLVALGMKLFSNKKGQRRER